MTKFGRLSPLLLKTSGRAYQLPRPKTMSSESTSEVSENDEKKEKYTPQFKTNNPTSIDDLEVPTNCCMSGCVNCVWIQYADTLSSVIKSSPADIQKAIMEKVEDPNMRAYLAMELRCRSRES